MESLTITIDPPITEYCTKCDYEASRSLGGYFCQCPKCGERSINSGARPSKDRPMTAYSYQGSFNLMNPSEKQWQYIFNNAPNGKRYSFVVDDELDTDDPIELARELKEIINAYLLNSSKPKIAELVSLFDTEDSEDRQNKLVAKDKKARLERELFELNYFHHVYDEEAE